MSLVVDCLERSKLELFVEDQSKPHLSLELAPGLGQGIAVLLSPSTRQAIIDGATCQICLIPADQVANRDSNIASRERSHLLLQGVEQSCEAICTLKVGGVLWEMLEIYGQGKISGIIEEVEEQVQEQEQVSQQSTCKISHWQSKLTDEAKAAGFISIGMIEEDKAGGDCSICLSQPRDTFFLPCRHLSVCCSCADRYAESSQQCPICRQDYKSIVTVIDKGDVEESAAAGLSHLISNENQSMDRKDTTMAK